MDQTRAKQVAVLASTIGGLCLMMFLSIKVLPKTIHTMVGAAPKSVLTVKDSYVLGDKILCEANGVDACTVNVFAIDQTGRGIEKKQVKLAGANNIIPPQAVTDKNGMASFKIVSKEAIQYKITATIDSVALPGSVKITFKNP